MKLPFAIDAKLASADFSNKKSKTCRKYPRQKDYPRLKDWT